MKKINIDRETLEDLYINKKMSLSSLSSIIGCSTMTAYNYCIKYNIKLRNRKTACTMGNLKRKGKSYEEQYGIKRARELRKKCSHAAGKTYEEMYGKEKSDIMKKNISISSKGRPNGLKGITKEKFFGIEKANNIKRKISKNSARYWLNKKRSPETIEKIRQATIKQLKEGRMPTRETNIEKIFKKALKNNNMKFEEQKQFKLGIADFYLPKFKAFVFCDGDYWHNYPNGKPRDSKQVEYLEQEDFKAYRFWGHEILDNVDNCINIIVEKKYK